MRVIMKPWGKELWFALQDEYVGKILYIKKGHRYSLQYHEHKKETQYVLKGQVKFYLGEDENNLKEVILGPGEKLDIYPGTIHRAEGVDDVEILEVSTNHLDDVVKLSDDYGRSGKGNNLTLDAELSKTQI
ncbi:MAG: cupin domain-containing protein [Candidatus Magasanikbacteria bacterium]|nr:cupin domain-containing protein [Candidatus Magasanikbacteria bacterium]MBT4221426.1 cupin domain-containing protein [Candidatus Magasanikbacteria bacterium]MBT4350726.1 cupin domain-containing protein [Candidatus Magasanikbacteria bacterium]MBT4541598.1 cupin domain-containing protein [Candidatus Magasanikbacteria bacterium]MBT6252959.1 cupin domain-containing protein [Candidatus Magasanikbacteria bacterium]